MNNSITSRHKKSNVLTTSRQDWGIKITLLLASTLTVMSGATISPSLPLIREVFAGMDNIDLLSRLVLTIPALFVAVFAPVAGVIVDRYGRKSLLIFSLALYGIAGSSGLYLDSLVAILVGRALLGISVAGVMTTSVTLIGDYFEGEERSSFMGLQAAFTGLGGFVFISGGGFLADIDWRLPFSIYLFSLFILPLAIFSVSDLGNRKNKGPSVTHAATPGVYSKLTVGILFTVVIIYMIVFYMVPVQMPFFLDETMDVNNTMTGIAISLLTLSSAMTSLFYQRIKRMVNFNLIYGIVFFMMALGYLLIWQSTHYAMVVAALLIAGVGTGLFMPNVNLHIMALAPVNLRGTLVSGITSAMFLGQFLSPIAVQPLVAQYSLVQAFMYSGIVIMLMAIAFILAGSRNRSLTSPSNSSTR